jgi:hypothetical protein
MRAVFLRFPDQWEPVRDSVILLKFENVCWSHTSWSCHGDANDDAIGCAWDLFVYSGYHIENEYVYTKR